MKRFNVLILGVSLLSLTSCFNTLSPTEVSEKTWTNNISQGAIFSKAFNFTLDRKVYENDTLVSTGIIENDNGNIHVRIDDSTEHYYELDKNDSYYFYYQEEPNDWVKIKRSGQTNIRADMLEYTILYPFEYKAFTYDKENELYYVNNYNSEDYKDENSHMEDVSFDYVEFKFLNNMVSSFAVIRDNTKLTLEARLINETHITIPEGRIIDTTNPYQNTKHRLDNIQVEQSEYSHLISDDFVNSYIYITGEAYSLEIEFVNFRSLHLVTVYYCSNSIYQITTKEFSFEIGKRNGYGSEYDHSLDFRVEGNASIKDNVLNVTFLIEKESKEEGPAEVKMSAVLVDKVEQYDRYEYESEDKVLQSIINNKKLEITSVSTSEDFPGPDVFLGGYIVISFDNNPCAELYDNDGMVAIGSPYTNSFDGEHFYVNFSGKLNTKTNEWLRIESCMLEATYHEDGSIVANIYYVVNKTNYYYRLTLSIGDNESLNYYSAYENRYIVDKTTWNKFFLNASVIKDGISMSYYKNDVNESFIYVDGMISYYKNDFNTREEERCFYEVLDSTRYYKYTFVDDSGWRKSLTTVQSTDTWLLEMFKLNETYDYDKATYEGDYYYTINSYQNYELVKLHYEFNTLHTIEKKYSDGSIENIGYTFRGPFTVELPEVNK